MAGDVLLRKGHIERDCLSKASIVKRRDGKGVVCLCNLTIDSGIERSWGS